MVPLVYVHGAGPQPPADDLRTTFEDALFPGTRPPVTVAYYADICWPPPSPGVAAASAASRDRAAVRLSSVIAATSAPGVTREAAARAILAAADGRLPGESMMATDHAHSSRRRRRIADPRAVELMEVFLEGADQAARAGRPASAAGQPRLTTGADLVAGVELLEPILRTVAGGAGTDVIRYLYQPAFGDPMRQRVRDAFAAVAGPFVIVAHSLGAIIAYDALFDPGLADRDVRLFVTIGAPLGISGIMTRLREGLGPGTVPEFVESWANFCDALDPVTIFGKTLSDKLPPLDFVHDVTDLDNPALNNHDLPGYLGLRPIREAIWRAVRVT